MSPSAVGNSSADHVFTRASITTPAQRGAFEKLWPATDTPESARYAARQGFWAAVAVSGVTVLMVFIAAAGNPSGVRLPFGPEALLDAVIFAVIAIGLRKESRVAAVAGLVVYILEQLYMLTLPVQRPASSFILVAVLLCGFVSGIRGTFALHDFRARGLYRP